MRASRSTARLVEQPAIALVVVRLEEAEGQVFELPLDLPDAEPVGQRREHLHATRAPRSRAATALARGVPAQRLQARGQAQQHHAQVAREREQHLAHALGLLRPARRRRRRRAPGAPRAGSAPACACGRPGSRSVSPKALATTSSGLLQVVAGVDEVGRGLHRRRGADGSQDGGHAVGVGERVLAGVQRAGRRAAARRRRGRGPAPHRASSRRAGAVVRLDAAATIGAASAVRRPAVRASSWRRAGTPAPPATWSGCTSVGAWPTPANSSSRARRAALRSSPAPSSRDSRSDSAPRSSSVGQRSAVVGLPQRGLAGGGDLRRDGAERHGDRRVVVRLKPSPSAASCGPVSASHCSRVCGPKPCEIAHR